MISIPHMDTLSSITLGLFVIGLVYAAGTMTQRIASLEQWRAEVRDELRDIKRGVDEVKELIRGEEV